MLRQPTPEAPPRPPRTVTWVPKCILSVKVATTEQKRKGESKSHKLRLVAGKGKKEKKPYLGLVNFVGSGSPR